MYLIKINNHAYLLTVITPGKRFKVQKQKGADWEPPYFQTLPDECTCLSRERPCKHLKKVITWNEARAHDARLEEARRLAEAAIDRAEREGTEEAITAAERAYRTWDLMERFK